MNRIYKLLLTSIYISLLAFTNAYADNQQLLATFPEEVFFFAKRASHPFIYASTHHAILVIKPSEQKIVNKISVPEEPRGLDLSLDGKKLYVATSSAQKIVVIDTQSMKVSSLIALPNMPYDLKVADDKYIYASISGMNYINSGFMQIDYKNNRFVKLYKTDSSDKNWNQINENSLIQADIKSKSIYFGDTYILSKYDVSKGEAKFIYKNEPDSLGSNLMDLHLSADGNYIYYVVGSGNWVIGYDIARIRTSDMSIQGAFFTGPYPKALTTSPDGKTVYTYIAGGNYDGSSIDVWDADIQTNIGKYALPYGRFDTDEVTRLTTDNNGEYLLVAGSKNLMIYRTGYPDSNLSNGRRQ